MTRLFAPIAGVFLLGIIASGAIADPKAPPKPTGPLLKLDGVKGESKETKANESIDVLSFAKRSPPKPRDPASGLPTGKRQ